MALRIFYVGPTGQARAWLRATRLVDPRAVFVLARHAAGAGREVVLDSRGVVAFGSSDARDLYVMGRPALGAVPLRHYAECWRIAEPPVAGLAAELAALGAPGEAAAHVAVARIAALAASPTFARAWAQLRLFECAYN